MPPQTGIYSYRVKSCACDGKRLFVGSRFSALSDFECSRSTHGCNGKADVVPSNLQFAMPDKSETGGRGESRNAGPSAGRDDAIGTVVVMGESMQRRKLARHLRPWMMTSKGSRVQRTRAAGGNYVAAMVRMKVGARTTLPRG